jgi:hypothetical protein
MEREITEGEQAMVGILPQCISVKRIRLAIVLMTFWAAGCAILPASAQQVTKGAIPGTIQLPNEVQSKSASDATSKGARTLGAPTIPIEEIIQRFAARELEFKTERDNFTYTQTFVIQTLDASGRPDGEYKMTSEIVFTPQGKRYEHVTYAPTPTLQRLQLSQQDFDDLEHVQPFVLTTNELSKYDIKYADHVSLDELNTYVFDVSPRTLEKNQRYFQGRIWVDDKDFEIVKTDGKAVPDIKKHGQENVFPRFETFRENVEGNYWFPTYTRSNDVLRFSSGDVPIRMTVRYENYKRFGVTVKIGKPAEKEQNKQ